MNHVFHANKIWASVFHHFIFMPLNSLLGPDLMFTKEAKTYHYNTLKV